MLVGCQAAETPEAAPEPLTLSEAGARYLGIVCPLNADWDRLDLTVDVLRQHPNAGAAELAAAKAAAAQLSAANSDALAELDQAEGSWPSAASPAIAELRAQIDAEITVLGRAARADQEAFLALAWPDPGDSAARARAALQLSDDPERNCTEAGTPAQTPKGSEPAPVPTPSN